jgi:class 3 adenylate cyclase/tetratricopeptide (TPR) repeat protein
VPFPGEQLGGRDGRRFKILEKLGEGGMGQVFRARDAELQREVALKFLQPHTALPEAARLEAQAIARLNHENIVRIFDIGEWRLAPGALQVPFLIMEYLEGESLASLLRRERPGLRRALAILDAIAAGLAHAHEQHIVHRDLKPSNVFLTPQGTVKLLDFGLAHLIATNAPRAPHPPTAGTPLYMAPEQWRGEQQDARTDIWSAGAVLYEMLTGRLPYPSTSSQELRARVTSAEPVPPVRTLQPELPQEVEGLLSTLLAKDPARRFSTVLELREELRDLTAQLDLKPEAPRPAAPQRRQVTLLRGLLTGLAELGQPLDPEDLGELEAAFHQVCSDVIQQHGGTVTLCMVGEVLACFGHLQTREDDAERAVRAGLHLAGNVLEALQRRMPDLPPSRLAVRVGLHTDLMVLDARTSDPRGRALTLPGEAPKVTAWLAGQAGPGEVLLGDTTSQLVRGAFELESLGPRVFEGVSAPLSLEVHRVLRERRATVRFDRTLAARGLTPMVGRERELRWLLARWEQARQGQGAVVLIHGEAGIGKSRLIREWVTRVTQESQEPAVLLRFQCWSQLGTSPLHPVIQLLQRLFQRPAENTSQQHLEELEERLGTLGLSSEDVHVLGLLLSLPVPEDSPVRLFTPERRKEKTFTALVSLLLRVAQVRPVLLTIEDLHWADSTQLEFLGFLLDRVEQAGVLVVLSARPEFQTAWPQRPWFHRLPLERLPAESAATLVKEAALGRALPEETLHQLVSKTDGIPLFIEEMTRMVLERMPSGAAREEGLPRYIPATLRELLQARLDMLSPRQKELTQLCAVLGRDFTHALLAALADLEDEALRRGLAGLMDAGLLQEREGAGEPGYQFRHALIQEAAYESLSRSMRRQHHRRIAQVLTERFPEVVQSRPEVLAHHHTEAGENEPATWYWARAGQLARMRLARVEAVSYLTRALKLLRGLPDASQHLREEFQLATALGSPLAQLKGFRSPEVERTFDRARELFRQVGEALPALEPAYWEVCGYYLTRAEFHLVQELAEQLVHRGEHQRDEEMRALGYRMMATALLCRGQVRTASEYIERAEACARFDAEPHRTLEVRQGVAPRLVAMAYAPVIYSVRGRPEQAQRTSQEVIELAGQINYPHATALALTCVAMACQFRGDVQGALTCTEKVIAIRSERNYWNWTWQAWSTFIRAWARARTEHSQKDLELLPPLLEEMRAQGISAGVPYTLYLLADLHLQLGQIQEGLATVQEALACLKATGERLCEAELHRLHGEFLRLDGREREARSRFRQALSLARQQGAGLFEMRAAASLGRLPRDMRKPNEGDAPSEPG